MRFGTNKKSLSVLLSALFLSQTLYSSMPLNFIGTDSSWVETQLMPRVTIQRSIRSNNINSKIIFITQDSSIQNFVSDRSNVSKIADQETLADQADYMSRFSILTNAKKRSQKAHLELSQIITSLKNKHFTPALKTFEDIRDQFDAREVGLSDYVLYLDDIVSAKSPNLYRLVQAARLEDVIDFARLESELENVSTHLHENLSKANVRILEDLLSQLRKGELSEADYLELVKNLANQSGIHFSGYLETSLYSKYVDAKNKIDSDMILFELIMLEEAVKKKLIKTTRQKLVVELSEDMRLISKLINHSMTKREWNLYLYRQEGIRNIENRLASLGVQIPDSLKQLNGDWKVFEEFYSYAVARMDARVGLTAARLANAEGSVALFVAERTPIESLVRELGTYDVHVVVLSSKNISHMNKSHQEKLVQLTPTSVDDVFTPGILL